LKKFTLILIYLFTLPTTIFASQYGSISGYFLDEHFEALPEGEILIDENNNIINSNEDGYFKIIGIEPGSYTLKFTYPGYSIIVVHNIQIQTDSDTELIVCTKSDVLDGLKYDYDASEAKITPYNPSQKNIDLEKTGKVDFKEKSKYPKLDFAEKYYLMQKEKTNQDTNTKPD